jgi:UrcA family protein
LLLRACVLGTLALSPLARAGSAPGAPTQVVRFHDLNLNSAQDARVLYGRIRRAAVEVCAPYEQAGNLIPSAAWRSCFAQAVATAVRRVDSPLLTAYHERQQGHLIASARQVASARQ